MELRSFLALRTRFSVFLEVMKIPKLIKFKYSMITRCALDREDFILFFNKNIILLFILLFFIYYLFVYYHLISRNFCIISHLFLLVTFIMINLICYYFSTYILYYCYIFSLRGSIRAYVKSFIMCLIIQCDQFKGVSVCILYYPHL